MNPHLMFIIMNKRKGLSMPNADSYADYLADKVLSRREELGRTQAQLAKQAGVSRHLVSSIENGAASGITLTKVLPVLGVLGLELLISTGISLPAHSQAEHSELDSYYETNYPLDSSLFGGER